jgi:alkanesulfonate monooxygenase SsuD/methylene tetrahydromethanopterin reductase-like flavin-dependent oxidoreductase (luciferase family)
MPPSHSTSTEVLDAGRAHGAAGLEGAITTAGRLEPDDIVERMRDVRERCEAEGRDPSTLRFSLYERDERMRDAGQARVDRLGSMAEIGFDRLVAFPTRWSPTLEAQASFAEDCRAAGIVLSPEGVSAGAGT